jgi:hypothetical protein
MTVERMQVSFFSCINIQEHFNVPELCGEIFTTTTTFHINTRCAQIPGKSILYSGASYLWIVSVELAS